MLPPGREKYAALLTAPDIRHQVMLRVTRRSHRTGAAVIVAIALQAFMAAQAGLRSGPRD